MYHGQMQTAEVFIIYNDKMPIVNGCEFVCGRYRPVLEIGCSKGKSGSRHRMPVWRELLSLEWCRVIIVPFTGAGLV